MRLTIILSLFLGWAASGFASEKPGHGASSGFTNLTLDAAIGIALDHHPQLAEFRALADAAAARAQTAGRFPNPEAVARVESAPISSGTLSQAEYVAGFSQPIPLGGRLSALRDLERATVDLREKELAAAALQLARSVHGAFATALFTTEVLQVQTNLAANLEELLRITTARVELGDAPPLALARLQAEEAQQRLAVREASWLHQEAMHDLAATLWDFTIPIQSLDGSLEEALQINSLQNSSIDGHPALAAVQSAVTAQRARVRLAEAERIPDVNLDLFYRRIEATRDHAFDIGIRVPIPLFDTKRSRVREAESDLRAVEARYQRRRNEIGHARHESELAFAKAMDTVDLLRTDVLPKIETSLRGAEARYAAGDTSLGDLLMVRREAATHQMKYLEALRSVLEAWARLSTLPQSEG